METASEGDVAEQNHYQMLREGAKAWNEWRTANPDVIPDLRYVEPSLGQKQFGPINGGPIDLRAALLFKADLRNATLSGADLRETELVEAELGGARLDNADLSGAKLVDASLIGADFAGAKLDRADVTGADLMNARNLSQAQVNTAIGDVTTQLPFDLVMPKTWISPQRGEQPQPSAARNFDQPVLHHDLYAILGAKKADSDETIHAVYRVRAKSLHPDLNPGDPRAEAAFRELTYAYAILRDGARRGRYDRGEIGPDGEETEAYRVNVWRAAKMQRLIRFAAVSAAVTVITCGVILSQLSGVRQWASSQFDAPSGDSTVVSNAQSNLDDLERLPPVATKPSTRSKTQSRIDDDLSAESPANADNADRSTPPPSDVVAEKGEGSVSADMDRSSTTSSLPHSPNVGDVAQQPAPGEMGIYANVSAPDADRSSLDILETPPSFSILMTAPKSNGFGPRLDRSVVPSPFAKSGATSAFNPLIARAAIAPPPSPRLKPCRTVAIPGMEAFEWIEKFRRDEEQCSPNLQTSLQRLTIKQSVRKTGAQRVTSRPLNSPTQFGGQ